MNKKKNPFRFPCAAGFAAVCLLLLGACNGGVETAGNGAESVPGDSSDRDSTPPTVTITGPTSGPSHVATRSPISLTGTASDNTGLSGVAWTNSTGGSGSVAASGTGASLNFSIALAAGSNVITVTATDTSGNTGQARLTVDYSPPPPDAGTAILEWDAVIATNLAGYRVHYGTSSGSYPHAVNVGNTTTHTLAGLTGGTRYYFAVTALDTTGAESGYSNEVFKDIP